MVKRALVVLLLINSSCLAQTMKTVQREGKEFGKKESSKALENSKQISADDLFPSYMKDKTFDPEEALKKIKEQKPLQSEALDFLLSEEVQRNERENKGFHEDELFLKNSEYIASHAKDNAQETNEEGNADHTLHTCKQSGDPFIITMIRELHVDVAYQREVKKQEKICKGHEKEETYFWKSDAKEAAHRYEKNFSQDLTIKSYDVDYKGSVTSDYVLKVSWKHYNNTENCHHYKLKDKVIQEKSLVEAGEKWVYDNPSLVTLSQGPDCTLIEQTCLDAETTKNMKGKSITRKCWKEKLSFFYQFPQIKDCLPLKDQNCEQIGQKCLQPTSFGCALWELTFKCYSKIIKAIKNLRVESLYGLDEREWETAYEPNHSFADIVTKLSVFDEIKKELEQANAFDASQVMIFKGQKMQCSKNVVGDLMYDCCFSYAGIAKQAGLAKCSSDEISLAEMREKGLCIYIGSYEEKMLDLWKSRDEHVYCCFPTKLARVVQQAGHDQLKKGWGTPKEPKCNGFSFEEITCLDFSKMDLSEVVDQLPKKLPEGFEQKMNAFQNRLKDQLAIEELIK